MIVSPPLDLLLCLALVLQLESPRFAERDRAYRALDTMGQRAVPAMLAGRKDAGTDAGARLDRLLTARENERWDMGPSMPWIDALPFTHPGRCRIIERYLSAADEWNEVGDYPRYRAATRLWVADLRRGGMTPEEVRKLLTVMHSREPLWRNGHGWPDTRPEMLPMPREVKP